MFTCRQEARSKELLTGHWRAVKGNATHPGPGASSPPCPLLFPAGAAAQEESPGARGAGPASCAPNPPRPLPPPPGATGSDRQAHLLPPAHSPAQAVFWRSCDRDGFTRRGRTWREAPSLSAALATGAAEAARRPRWRPDRGSHFPSATARAQVRRAEPRRRGRGEPVDTPPRGVQAAPREEAAEPRLVRAEPSRAEPAPPPAPRPGTPPAQAWAPAPGTSAGPRTQQAGHASCAPRHGSLRCVGRRPATLGAPRRRAPSSLPRSPAPRTSRSAVPLPLCPASSVRESVFFLFFSPVLCRILRTPTFPLSSSQPAARFPAGPA